MKNSVWFDIGIALIFILLQVLLFQHLDIRGIQTDVVFVFLLWFAMRKPRTYVLFFAAGTGLVLDILLDTWGVHTFSKTLTILIIHGFLTRQAENILQPTQVFLLVSVIALFYNLIFLIISAFAGIYSLELSFLHYWLGNSIYIAVTATFFHMVKPV